MTQRFLLEKFKDGPFTGLREKQPDTHHGLAYIGTWMKGFQKGSDGFSVTSFSLS